MTRTGELPHLHRATDERRGLAAHHLNTLLLHAACYHLSRSVVENMILAACLEANIPNLEDVNHFLLAYKFRPFIP